MGAWGTGLFQDDYALDVRDDYRDLIIEGAEGPDATDELLERHREHIESDPVHGPIFWLALAVTQWEAGRLEQRVKRRALQVITRGEGLDIWADDPTHLKRRRAALEKVRAKLERPQPKPKRLRPPPAPRVGVGDVVEIATPAGLAYAWYTHHDESEGPLLRVAPGLFAERPSDLCALVRQPPLFFAYCSTLDHDERKGLVAVVGRCEPAESERQPAAFRTGYPQPGYKSVWKRSVNGRAEGSWMSWEDLPLEMRRLSPDRWITHEQLVQRVVTQWTPEQSAF